MLITHYVNKFSTPSPSRKLNMKKVKAIQIAVQVVLFLIFFIQMQKAVTKYLGNNLYNFLTAYN